MSTTWTLAPTTFKQNFVAGWTKYVKPAFSFPPQAAPPDMYWDPRKGGWYLYPTSTNDVEDKGWPKTDISGVFVVPETTFDHITDQYMALPPAEQPFACWDPRRGQWLAVKGRTAGGATNGKHAALNELIHQVEAVHQKGYLSWGSTETIRHTITNEL
jgi:hypothetical protein